LILSGEEGMFQNKVFNLVLSILAAFVIWAFVLVYVNPTSQTTVHSIPVELINLDALAKDGLAVSTAQTYLVDVVAEGARAEVAQLQTGDLKASADMKGFAKGMNSVRVSVNLPSGITKVEIRPERIDINVEERVSVMKPIRLEYTEDFPKGMEPGFISLSPQEIEVSGTKLPVDSVAYIRAQLDTAEISREARTITVDAVPLNRAGEPINDLSLSQSTIDVSVQLCSVKEVPLRIKTAGEPEEGKAVSKFDIPKSVSIRGAEEKINNIIEVSAKDINISGLSETTIFIPELNLPPDVELASASQNLRATVEVEGIETKLVEYTADQILVTGAAVGYSAHVNTAGIKVTVYGTVEQLEKFNSAGLVPYVDLTGYDYKENNWDFEVLFRTEQEYYKLESDPRDVRVIINKESRLSYQ
jgi:YbbR domain-containing protein